MPVELKTCLQRWQWYGTKLFSLRWVLLVLVLAALYFGSKYNYYGGSRPDLTDVTSVRLKHVRIHKLSNSHGHHRIHVVVVVCNNRTQQALTMIKSMITFSSQIIDLHLFVEDALKDTLSDQLHQWNKLTPNRVVLNFYSIRFPGGHEDEWIKLFKPCACQRLFMPELLSQLDAAIYVDTDTLFMHNVSDLWSEFAHFSADHIAGLSSESEDGGSSWYNRFARHPYVKPYGVNSGVFLMNLTRMRQFGWMRHLWPTFKAHASVLTWGDQDIINIIFAKHGPGKLYMLGCEWNFRPDHCMYDLTCTDAQFDGAKLIHGSRGSFYNRKQLPFTLLSDVFNKYEYGTDVRNNLYEPFYNKLISADRMDSCSKYPAAFYGQLTIYLAIS